MPCIYCVSVYGSVYTLYLYAGPPSFHVFNNPSRERTLLFYGVLWYDSTVGVMPGHNNAAARRLAQATRLCQECPYSK